MSFPALPRQRAGLRAQSPAGLLAYSLLPLLSLLLAALLGGCGGGSASSSSSNSQTSSGGDSTSLTTPASTTGITAGSPTLVTLPSGAALKGLGEALVVGEHVIVLSASDAELTLNKKIVHPRTRLSVLDKNGALISSVDYGFKLADGYVGDWLLLPSTDGFVMLQAGPGTRMLQFDAQARQIGAAQDLYPTVAASSTTELAAAENAAAVDGNGFWLATTFSLLPINDKTQYLLKLCKYDFAGRQLTPPFQIASSAVRPRVATSDGTVLTTWLDGSTAMLAMWPRGLGAPLLHSLGTSGAQPQPVALDSKGKMGAIWNGKASFISPGGVLGVALDKSGVAVLPTGRTELGLEILSTQWAASGRAPTIDARLLQGRLLLADVAVGTYSSGDPQGDVIVLADYAVGTAALSAQKSTIQRMRLYGGNLTMGNFPVLRQLIFADHTLLLVGDEYHLEAFRITRQ